MSHVSGDGNRQSNEAVRSVVDAVAEAEDVDPVALPPAARTVESDALDRVVRDSDGLQRVQFECAGRRVVVEEDSAVELAPPCHDG